MAPGKRMWILGAVLAALTPAFAMGKAAGQPAATPAALGDVRVESIDVRDVGPESLTIAVRVSTVAKQSAVLRSLAFEDVTINDVRVGVPPVSGPVTLREGEPVDGLPPLEARLVYRDLESMEPLRRAVSTGSAQVRARIRAQLQLSLFQKIVLLAGQAWIAAPLDQSVPVTVPGGMLGRAAATTALLAAEPVWAAGRAGIEWRQQQSERTQKVREQVAGSLFVLETRYILETSAGETATVRHRSMGFLVSGGGLLVPAEALEPWLFDPAVAEAIDHKDVKVHEKEVEVVATPAAGAAGRRTFSLREGSLKIVKKLNGSETAISLSDQKRYKVRIRGRESNAALLSLVGSTAGQGGLATAEPAATSDWNDAAILRINPARSGAEPEVVLTTARLENGRIMLSQPADAASFGSPVLVDGKVVGILQDQDSCARALDVLKKLR